MIKFGKLGFTLELRNDRPDLDFYSAFEDVAVYFFEFGTCETRSNTCLLYTSDAADDYS
jgi:hypothetical protein